MTKTLDSIHKLHGLYHNINMNKNKILFLITNMKDAVLKTCSINFDYALYRPTSCNVGMRSAPLHLMRTQGEEGPHEKEPLNGSP